MADIDEKVLARRQRDLDRFTENMADKLHAAAGDFAKDLLPTWKHMEVNITKKVQALYAEIGATDEPKQLRVLKTKSERLEALHNSIVQDIKTVEAQYQPAYTVQLYNTFENSYYMTGYGLEQAVKVAATVPVLSTSQVLGVLANPWLSDGANYSARLRGNTATLAARMKEIVEAAVEEGHSWNTTAHNIVQAAGEGYFNAVRLARTEMTRAASLASSYTYMQNADILDGKRWNATLDSKTAPRDAANDGKTYDLDYDTPESPGVAGQRIPNHPHCRCIWSPILSALGINNRERFARYGDGPGNWGQGKYTEARTYEDYAEARGLPSLNLRLALDNPKSYLRRGETVADMQKVVKRWTYNGAAITVPRALWDNPSEKLKPIVQEPQLEGPTAWKPATTVKEATDWAMTNLDIVHVDYKGFHLDVANDVNKTLSELRQKYPEVDNIHWVTTMQERNIANYNYRYSEYVNSLVDAGYSKKHAEIMAKNRIKKSIVSADTYASSTDKRWKNQQGICYNKKYASDPEEFKRCLKNDVNSGFHPPGCDTYSSVLTHEFGHRLNEYLNDNNLGDWIRQSFQEFQLEAANTDKGFKDLLSKYGSYNEREFFAEAFSEYTHSFKPRKTAKMVGEKIEEILKQIRGK